MPMTRSTKVTIAILSAGAVIVPLAAIALLANGGVGQFAMRSAPVTAAMPSPSTATSFTEPPAKKTIATPPAAKVKEGRPPVPTVAIKPVAVRWEDVVKTAENIDAKLALLEPSQTKNALQRMSESRRLLAESLAPTAGDATGATAEHIINQLYAAGLTDLAGVAARKNGRKVFGVDKAVRAGFEKREQAGKISDTYTEALSLCEVWRLVGALSELEADQVVGAIYNYHKGNAIGFMTPKADRIFRNITEGMERRSNGR